MAGSTTFDEAVDLDDFRSPVRVLARSFLRSRDNWKRKYQELKSQLKRCQVKVHDVEQSRQRWREKAEAGERELAALQAELQALQRQVGSAADEPIKKGTSKMLAAIAPVTAPLA